MKKTGGCFTGCALARLEAANKRRQTVVFNVRFPYYLIHSRPISFTLDCYRERRMENVRIADQLRRCAKGSAWHGPSLEEVLEGVRASQASQFPPGARHSIAELTLHIATWARVSTEALHGTAMPQDLPEDWSEVTSIREEEWSKLQKDALAEIERLAAAVVTFPEERLTEIVPGRKYDFYFLLHGVVQHTIYHAGQIAVLKRMLNASA